MKAISVWLVMFVTMTFAIRYTFQTWRREITPTLSTWIIFAVGTGLSLATYAIAEKHDFRSGILNTMDIVAIIIVLIAILLWGKREVRFKHFEKWYLAGTGAIIVYGVISGDAWISNVFTQILISIGYLPTIQNLITQKKNSESFTSWGCGTVAGIIALYPAFVEGNALAILYAIRTIILTTGLIALMLYYELRNRKPHH